MSWKLYAFFWVIPRRLNFICRRFGTLCSIFMGRYVRVEWTGLGTCLGILYGERFGSEMVWAIRTEGDRVHSTRTYLPKKMERRHIKFRLRGITQNKAYNKTLATFSSDVASNEKHGGSRSQPVLFDCAHWRTDFETLKMNVHLAECTEIKQWDRVFGYKIFKWWNL